MSILGRNKTKISFTNIVHNMAVAIDTHLGTADIQATLLSSLRAICNKHGACAHMHVAA